MTLSRIKSDLQKFGCAEIAQGVYLSTSEYMISEEKNWAYEQEREEDDYSLCKFYITTDDGQDAMGVDSIKEALESIK